jgi:hypothetical protein
LGFEIVCDLDDGFVAVAADEVELSDFLEKVDHFKDNKQRSGAPAKVYGLRRDEDRLAKILSKTLYDKWSMIDGTMLLTADISVEGCGLVRSVNLPEKKRKCFEV